MRSGLGIMAVLSLMVGLLAAGAAAAPGGGDGQAAGQGSGEGAIPGRYIVVLDADAAGAPTDVAAEHSRRFDVAVSHVYRHALRGYAAQMSDQALARVGGDDRVAYIDADRRMTALHHECGHDGGPPGSGSSSCSAGTVSGTVTDADTGDGIDGASVTLDGSTDYSTTTDSTGDYSIDNVEGGDYTATADADGYDAESKDITVDGDTTVDFALTASSTDDGGGSGDQVVPWGVERIGAPTAHGNGNTGAGIDVYVLDTGIDLDHGDLDVHGGYAVEECKGGGCQADYDDDHGHGTHVAGTAAALDNTQDVLGVAPDANLWAVKVLDHRGSGSWSGVIEGIDWVASQDGHPSAANMSFGGSGSKDGTCTDSGFTGTDSLHEAICNAANQGVVFSVAAGNDGEDAENSVPAAYDDAVITASATDDTDDWPSWSNWGDDAADWTTNDSAPVALAAPGVDVLSTQLGGGTTTASGTSMASPHVGGGAALFLEANSQSADYSAFANTRSGLLDSDESLTDTSDDPHAEDLLSVD